MRAAFVAVCIALVAGGGWLAFGGTDECRAQGGGGDVEARPGCASSSATACAADAGFVRAAAVPKGRNVRFRFTRKVKRAVTVEVFQSSIGRRVLGNRRIARFTGRKRSFTWDGRRARDGYLFVRFRVRAGRGTDVRRSVLRRHSGRFSRAKSFYRRASCATLAQFKLERPVFGRGRALGIAYRVGTRSQVSVVVRRGKKVVRRFKTRSVPARKTVRLRVTSRKRGRHRVQITVRPARGVATKASLYAQRL